MIPMRHLVRSMSSFSPAGLGRAGVVAVLLAGCSVAQPPAAPPQAEQELRNVLPAAGGGQLINEGGPVFLLPGTLRMPTAFKGELGSLVVRAERLDGGSFPHVPSAAVSGDGTFTLRGPLTSKLFFATTEFSAEDKLYRVRALARAESGEPIVLDTASALVAAKIALAAQKRALDDLSLVETTEVTSQVRSALAASLEAVSLDQPNETLSGALDAAASRSAGLAKRLTEWEAKLLPASPTPGPSPSATPSPSPSPEASFEPIK